METYPRAEAAERAGVTSAELDSLIGLKVLKPDAEDRWSEDHGRVRLHRAVCRAAGR